MPPYDIYTNAILENLGLPLRPPYLSEIQFSSHLHNTASPSSIPKRPPPKRPPPRPLPPPTPKEFAVRIKLVRDWLIVLIVCKENVSPMLPSHKSLYLELEEKFLRIISTLPMCDAQELLQQCLNLSTRNVEDCPHLVSAFNTWFHRAGRAPHGDSLS